MFNMYNSITNKYGNDICIIQTEVSPYFIVSGALS